MNTKINPYKAVFVAIIVLQTIFLISIPLIHLMNDSGWYFMNVHFVNTGNYINESRYPSFDEPSQLYSFFGYSFYLFICEKISQIGIDFSLIVKFGQILMYIFSAIIVKKIMLIIVKKENLAYIIGIAFLLYYPFFNFVNLVMSEMYATFLILLTCYYFMKIQVRFDKISAAILFLLAGYIILVKPIFLPISVAILVLYSIKVLYNRQYTFLPFVLLIVVFPLSQAIFSKNHYDNYKLQSGLGWHLWNRLILYDKQIPESSVHLSELKAIYKAHNKPVSYGFWWDVTKDLSEFGYNEVETQKICENIGKDAIAEKPVRFVMNTFKNSYYNFITDNTQDWTYDNADQYLKRIAHFSTEQQHKPLTDQLSKQTYYSSYIFNDKLLTINNRFAQFNYFNVIFHNSFVFLLYILAGIQIIYSLLYSRFKRNQKEFILWFAAFAIIFGSNFAEFPQSRLIQPAVIFVILIVAIKLYELKVYLTKPKEA